ncbi:GNAT family N-acetyltransferase [Staphylococcus saprophyticus]|uniref:GNAT family N-acetyltransferase n=1 Tax=Staphylococcus saprophyticus TaxID=29385 RepID=UPI000852EEC5|nr:GNAT family N-acetyltransferase [Staphylococcus saprophyticus]ASE58051.1 N-acetyltransferase [Staphylococcus saprophyticus]MBN6756171.1 GNAT family N-acetyltransferase [Staphylococcus saprophyticus]MBN6766149.1 GNAT family N-acetyltransferase [Staphylococcus saprophyticus]MBN6770950.1 GNAT family N-acetyltransferase [Staphylococcus saprophyticus]MBN6780484.1 GNAT family N-acetyltransferase [Staphylococcus saprophyticus]
MTIEARLFEEQDLIKIKELLVLYEDLGYPTITEDLVNRLKKIYIHEDYYLLLLIKDDVIIGLSGMCKMMFYEKNGEYMRLLAFVINSNYRGKGYGTLLLKESEILATQLGCEAITLNSGNREERDNAHSFYKTNGFENKSSGFSKSLA